MVYHVTLSDNITVCSIFAEKYELLEFLYFKAFNFYRDDEVVAIFPYEVVSRIDFQKELYENDTVTVWKKED